MLMKAVTVGGGGEKLIKLWSRAVSSYSGGTETLSQGMPNFDELKIVYQLSTSDTTKHYIKFDLATFNSSSAGRYYYGGYANSANFMRMLMYVSDTSIEIGNAYKMNVAANDSSAIIPIEIYGVTY